jgi:hypothetical protein
LDNTESNRKSGYLLRNVAKINILDLSKIILPALTISLRYHSASSWIPGTSLINDYYVLQNRNGGSAAVFLYALFLFLLSFYLENTMKRWSWEKKIPII